MEKQNTYFAENLRFLREKAALSLRDLSKKVHVSHTMLNKYEKELCHPQHAILKRISRFFKVPLAQMKNRALYQTVCQMETIDFRTSKDVFLEDSQKEALEQTIIQEMENHLFVRSLLTHVKFKRLAFEPFPLRSRKDIPKAAQQLRNLLGIRHPYFFNFPDILYDQGIIHIPLQAAHSQVEGVVGKYGYLYYVATASETTEEKQRFTIAHELAHLLLDIDMETIKTEYSYWVEDANNDPEIYRPIIEEKICSEFAGFFLLPWKSLKKELGINRNHLHWYELLLLHRRYKVSLEMVITHASKCKIIDYAERDRLFDLLESKIYGQFPLERSAVEQNNRFIQLVCEAVTRQLLEPAKAAEILNCKSEKSFVDTYLLDYY